MLQQDHDLIFLDPGNLSIVAEEAKNKRDYFASLKAVKTGNVYAMPSYNQYSTNMAYSLANAYYAGTVLFPEAFADVNFAAKFDEIVSFFKEIPQESPVFIWGRNAALKPRRYFFERQATNR